MLPLSDFASYFDIARFLICSYDEQKWTIEIMIQ
jgi:hypothetical protein